MSKSFDNGPAGLARHPFDATQAFGAEVGRRAFLRRSFGGAALLAAAAWATPRDINAADDGAALPSTQGLRFLAPWEAAVLIAVAEALVGIAPPETLTAAEKRMLPPGLPKPGDTFMLQYADEALASLDEDLREQAHLMIRVVEYAPIAMTFYFARMTRLPLADRQLLLRGWGDSAFSAFRQIHNALKLLLLSFYWADPQTWAFLGYDGPRLQRVEDPYFDPPLGRGVLPALPILTIAKKP